MRVDVDAEVVLDKTVKVHGDKATSGVLYVPKEWKGRAVKVILLPRKRTR